MKENGLAVGVGALVAASALAGEGRLSLDADAVRLDQAQAGASPPATESGSAEAPAAAPTGEFGLPGPWYWHLGGGWAKEIAGPAEADDFNLNFTLSTFVVEDFEFLAEFRGWYFHQQDDDALGLNFNLIFRWHFLDFETWTIFADGGVGMLVSTDNVPDGGTGFNYTPQAGGGATFRLGESRSRLVVGARWNHVSNARINGEDRNPSRDGIQVYAAVQIPF